MITENYTNPSELSGDANCVAGKRTALGERRTEVVLRSSTLPFWQSVKADCETRQKDGLAYRPVMNQALKALSFQTDGQSPTRSAEISPRR